MRINGFGSFSVSERGARMGRNPATGESIKIKASKNIRFKAAKAMKDALDGKKAKAPAKAAPAKGAAKAPAKAAAKAPAKAAAAKGGKKK